MKGKIFRRIIVAGILVVSLPGLVASALAASLLVEAKPNPATAGKQVTITVSAADEGIKYLYGQCDLVVNFGDGSAALNIGKLTSQPGGLLSKTTTHTYPFSRYDKTYTISVAPANCDAAKVAANTVKTTVKVVMARIAIKP